MNLEVGSDKTLADGKVRAVAVTCNLWCWLGPLAVVSLVAFPWSNGRSDVLRSISARIIDLQIVVVTCSAGWFLAGLAGWVYVMLFLMAIAFGLVLYGYVVGVIAATRVARGEAWLVPVPLRLLSRP